MYHELARDDADIEAWTVMREGDFVRQLEFLVRHYDVVSLDQALARTQSTPASTRPKVVITFDDGDSGNATVLLPIIEAFKIPVTIYIATRQVAEGKSFWFDRIINALQINQVVTVDLRAHGLGTYQINRVRGKKNWHRISCLLEDLKSLAPDAREAAVESVRGSLSVALPAGDSQIEPMSVGQVRALAACPFVTIGAHSHCHNILPQLPPGEIEQSIRLSKALLEKWSGRPVDHFAYPDGSYNDTVIEIVRRAGFRSAVITEPRLWRDGDSPFGIPRIGVGRYDSLEKLKLNLIGGIRGVLPWRRDSR
ncbi:MAG: polysaccharide deacetylase family protein [Burkholderiales bacterium]